MPRLSRNAEQVLRDPACVPTLLARARAALAAHESLPGHEGQEYAARAAVASLEAAELVLWRWPDSHVAVWRRLVAAGVPMVEAVTVARGIVDEDR